MEQKIAQKIIKAFRAGNKLLIVGNGGSAAEAQHMAAELVCRYKYKRRALPAIALTTDSSILTAWGNDYSFEDVFVRQIEALGRDGDILLTISTSGKSQNVLRARKKAEVMGMIVIDLPKEGKDTPAIQENQLRSIHKICGKIEEAFL